MIEIKSAPYYKRSQGYSWRPNEWKEECFTAENVNYILPVEGKIQFNDKKMENLNGVKRVYFVKQTYFNRAIFKEMYPDIRIVKNRDKADAIIYSPKNIKNNYAYSGGKSLYLIYEEGGPSFFLDLPFMRMARKRTCNIPRLSFFDPEVRFRNKAVLELHTINPQSIDMIRSIESGLPHIDTDTVFREAKLEIREDKSISLEDMISLTDQVYSDSPAIENVAIDIVAQLDINRFYPFQAIIWEIYKRTSRTSQTRKSKLMGGTLKRMWMYSVAKSPSFYYKFEVIDFAKFIASKLITDGLLGDFPTFPEYHSYIQKKFGEINTDLKLKYRREKL
jgi:hypothetical protein